MDDIVRDSSSDSTQSEQAYEIIENRIVTLKMAPGSSFSESNLSDSLGIGRTPVREALQRLAFEHLVMSIPRVGMIVTEINISDMFSLLDTRIELDALLIRQCIQRARPDEVEMITAYANQMQLAADRKQVDKFMRIDRLFDLAVFNAARNRYAMQAVLPLHAHCRRFWYYSHTDDDLTRPASLHVAIKNAIVARDAEKAVESSNILIDFIRSMAKTMYGIG